tara:strand:+ start:359 stop:901 length:543 start_codon:yes stop_codon:yes gene_type:complete
MSEESDKFLKQMAGVIPIKKNNRMPIKRKTNKTENVKKKTKLKNNIKTTIAEKNNEKSEYALQNLSIKKNIKRNLFSIDKKIDFHGTGLLEAEEIFSSTIIRCFNNHQRCLLFITGKGVLRPKDLDYNNKPKLYHGVIRAEFFNWVKSKKLAKYILSFEKASIEHGGDGAFYVYLRKNKI